MLSFIQSSLLRLTGKDTTTDGKQAFWIIGDSNADGRGVTLGPTTISGTCYVWNGSSLVERTTQDVSNAGTTLGTAWKQFALDYNANYSKKVVLIQSATGGSNFYPDGDSNNWYTGATVYSLAKTKTTDCLSFLGINKLKGIFIVLGINDFRAGTALPLVYAGIDSLLNRLIADFPNTPIIISQVGRSESVAHNSNLYAIRAYIIEKCKVLSNVHLLGGPNTFIGISGGYNGDLLHYSQTSNNWMGAQYVRWYKNSSYTNKWSRSIISTMNDELSTTRKDLINTFVTNQINNGNYWKLEHLSVFKTTNQNNIYIDWSFLGYTQNNTTVQFSANTYTSSNGTSNHYNYSFIPNNNTRASSQNDFINGLKLKNRITTAGTTAVLFGANNGSSIIQMAQNATNVFFRANDATLTTSPDSALTNNTLHSTARTGGTKHYLKNTTVTTTASVASVSLESIIPAIGAYNNAGVVGNRFAGDYEYTFSAQYYNFNLVSFYTDIEALITAW